MTRRLTLGHPIALLVLTLLVAAVFGAVHEAALAKDEPQKAPVPIIASFLVQENSTQAWQTIADHPQGADIAFAVTGTLLQDLTDLETLPYRLLVRIPDGLDYLDGTARVVLKHEGGGQKDVTSALQVRYDEASRELSAGSDDLTESIPYIVASDELVLYYQTRINDATKMGLQEGNVSWARLEYAYDETTVKVPQTVAMLPVARLVAEVVSPITTLQKSVEMSTTVHTYAIRIKKLAEDTGEPMKGVSFVLRNGEGLWYVSGDDWSDDREKATVVTTDADGMASFPYVDSGHHELVEVEAPQGYEVADVIDIDIRGDASGGRSATYLDATSFVGVEISAEAQTGIVDIIIRDRPLEKEIDIPLPLTRTADESATPAPLFAISVLALLCAVAARRVGQSRNTYVRFAGLGSAGTREGTKKDACH